jgi:hypothetical protein
MAAQRAAGTGAPAPRLIAAERNRATAALWDGENAAAHAFVALFGKEKVHAETYDFS